MHYGSSNKGGILSALPTVAGCSRLWAALTTSFTLTVQVSRQRALPRFNVIMMMHDTSYVSVFCLTGKPWCPQLGLQLVDRCLPVRGPCARTGVRTNGFGVQRPSPHTRARAWGVYGHLVRPELQLGEDSWTQARAQKVGVLSAPSKSQGSFYDRVPVLCVCAHFGESG